jgi:hypothetical protein
MAFNKGMFFETNYCRGDPHSPFISNSQKIHMYKGERQKTKLQTTTDLSIHDDKMGTVHFFTLYLRRVTSESNPALQSLKVG